GYDPRLVFSERPGCLQDKSVSLRGLPQGAYVVSSLFRWLSMPTGVPCVSRGLKFSIIALCAGLSGSGCARARSTMTARSETAERLSAEARQAKVRGDSQSAEQLLTEAVERNPGDCETRLELSEMLLAHGSTEAAVFHLQKLIDQNPDDPRSYVGLGEG